MQPSDDLQHLDGVDSIGGTSSSAGQGEGYDDEPVLKYQRMGADVGKLLADRESEAEGAPADSSGSDAGEEGQRETILRMAVHDSYLVRGGGGGGVGFLGAHALWCACESRQVALPILFCLLFASSVFLWC